MVPQQWRDRSDTAARGGFVHENLRSCYNQLGDWSSGGMPLQTDHKGWMAQYEAANVLAALFKAAFYGKLQIGIEEYRSVRVPVKS